MKAMPERQAKLKPAKVRQANCKSFQPVARPALGGPQVTLYIAVE